MSALREDANSLVLLEFFYDVISPYSWLAYEVLSRYRTEWNIHIKMMPILLRGIMKGTGNSPPILIPNKGRYAGQDIARLSKFYSVPLQLPENIFEVLLEKGSLNAQRFLTAVDMFCPEFTEPVSREMWMRIYSRHQDITQPESFKEVAESCRIDKQITRQLLSSINTTKVKDRLKETTNKALEYGAFGAPTIVAHIDGRPELFFGCDRMELLAYMLDKKWQGPVPSFQRSML